MYFSCIVYFEDEKVVELNRGNDNCNTRFENSKVCLENYVKPQEGIFSCIAKIDSFNRRLEGKFMKIQNLCILECFMIYTGRWEIEIIKKVVRTDEVKELATIDATLIGEFLEKLSFICSHSRCFLMQNFPARCISCTTATS